MTFPIETAAGSFLGVDDDYALIADVPTSTAGWWCTNLDVLVQAAPKRGTDGDIIPGADGRLPNPLYADQFDVALELTLSGVHDWLGDPQLSDRAAVYRNRRRLLDAWGPIPDNTDSTVALELYIQGDTWAGDVQIVDLRTTENTALVRLLIPAGALEEVGS
jgi:hypothetical protein